MSVLREVDARMKLLFLLAYAVCCLHARSVPALALCAVAAVAASVAVRVRPGDVASALRFLVPVLAFTAVMQVLCYQQGQVVASLGPLVVTSGSLGQAARMVVALACLMAVNVAFMRCTAPEDLVAAFGWAIAPLRRLGVRTDSLMLSLLVTFRFAPVLVGDFNQLKRAQVSRLGRFDGPVHQRVAAYARLFPPLVRGSFARADTLAEGFACRCFNDSGARTSLHSTRLGLRDAACGVASVAFVACFALLA